MACFIGKYPERICRERTGRDMVVAVEGRAILNDPDLVLEAALEGLGLAYLFDRMTLPFEREGRLERVLQRYCIEEPGLHLYFSSRAQVMSKLRAFIDFARARLMPPPTGG